MITICDKCNNGEISAFEKLIGGRIDEGDA